VTLLLKDFKQYGEKPKADYFSYDMNSTLCYLQFILWLSQQYLNILV